ncbi:hypothetical protein PC115_g8653 [Phytophthora cactorum]|uniref:Uncharacterized protein n=1 Tax=Phytophthora cactorum TaxID=29920 RepID=A0A8T1CME1_9STRA|nr:hypothetical protein PC115_g8653 [Phytophthora cactorum]
MIRRRTCKICMHQCCARCCVSKKMFFVPAHSRAAVQKIANVCTNCIQTASYSNGMDIALGEISRTAGQFKALRWTSNEADVDRNSFSKTVLRESGNALMDRQAGSGMMALR